jgi:hypothetical protein
MPTSWMHSSLVRNLFSLSNTTTGLSKMHVAATDPPSMHDVSVQPTSPHPPSSHTANPEPQSHDFTPPSIPAIRQTTPPHALPPSPPDTPQVMKTTSFAPTNTPTKLGIMLARQTNTKSPTPLTLDKLWKNSEKMVRLKDSFKRFCESNGMVINDKKTERFLNGCKKVASAMVIGPPTDPEYAQQHTSALSLVFSLNMRLETPRFVYLMVVS